MSSCFSRCLRVPIAMRRFYEQSLWIPQKFLFTNLDLHHGLLGGTGSPSVLPEPSPRRVAELRSVSTGEPPVPRKLQWASAKPTDTQSPCSPVHAVPGSLVCTQFSRPDFPTSAKHGRTIRPARWSQFDLAGD